MMVERIFRIIGSFGFTFQFQPSPLMRAENISTPDGYMKRCRDTVKFFTTMHILRVWNLLELNIIFKNP